MKIVRVLSVGLVALAMTACGETEREKAQSQSTDLVSEHNTLVREMRNSIPTSRSSDQEIAEFEAKVNRLEAIRMELSRLNGTNGITITGGTGPELVAVLRKLIADVREEKASGRFKRSSIQSDEVLSEAQEIAI